MNIKSLLLGSAAAFSVVSGAQAADVVVAQPEPVEYVKVCDAYGAGFFYIPGTDTCIQFSGYVRMQLQTSGYKPGDTPGYYTGVIDPATGEDSGWFAGERVRFNVDVRSETELGTLRGFFRFQGGNASGTAGGDIPTGFDQAYIDFLGFRMGYTESAWDTTATGGVSNWGSHSDGGMYYSYQQRDQIAYNFAQNGFFGTVSLENDANANYMPDVVGKLGYSGGWGGVWAKAAYDEDNGLNTAGGMTGNDAWSVGLGAQINMPNMPGSNLRLLGYYNSADNSYGTYSPVKAFGGWGQSEWSVMASYQQQFNEKFSASVAYQYFNNFYQPYSSVKTGFNGWGGELSLVYLPVKNFEVRTEIHYDKVDTLGGTWSGFLRFARFF